MSNFLAVVAVIITLAVAYQIYISRRVLRSRHYSDDQLVFQLIMIWLLPVIGASVCHWMLNNANAGDVPEEAADEPSSSEHGGHDSEE